jgi:hypothetical protein
MADRDLYAIVWGETRGLSPKDSSDQTRTRLQAVIAKLALAARQRNLDYQFKRSPAPRADDVLAMAAYSPMLATVDAAASGTWRPEIALPARAVLWQLNEGGFPQRDGALPKSAAWIFATDAKAGGDFLAGTGPDQRTYRLFETDTPPAENEMPYLSGFTGCGITVLAASANLAARNRLIAWALGIVSAIVFLAGGVSAIWSGQSAGAARSQVKATDTQYAIVDKLADNCIADATLFPNWKRSICSFLDESGKYVKPAAPSRTQPQPPATGATAPDSAATPPVPQATAQPTPATIAYGPKVGQAINAIKKCLNVGIAPPPAKETTGAQQAAATNAAADEIASCELVARSAADAGIVDVAPPRSFLDGVANSLLGLRSVANTRSIIVQLLAMTLGIAGLVIALGIGTKGRITGVWIDERNRVSLARAQVTLWTIVALGGFAAIALFNIGLAAPVAFPQIPASIAAALGIAFASPMISALILDKKNFAESEPLGKIKFIGQTGVDATDFSDREVAASSQFETRSDPAEASLADVFVGEHVGDSAQVDISRLQNVVLTVTLVLGYFAMLVGQLSSIPADSLLSGLPSLPDAGATFTSVLLVSHATYLGTKAYGGSKTQPTANP